MLYNFPTLGTLSLPEGNEGHCAFPIQERPVSPHPFSCVEIPGPYADVG